MANNDQFQEKRGNQRYPLERRIQFHFAYDFTSEVKYQPFDPKEREATLEAHTAQSKNISLEGLCVCSREPLKKGERLNMELYLPGDAVHPIHMQGEVRWCRPAPLNQEGGRLFDAGVKLETVEGKKVHESVYFDETYKIYWSSLLDTVLGKVRQLQKKKLEAPKN